jgi:hypothetical protein
MDAGRSLLIRPSGSVDILGNRAFTRPPFAHPERLSQMDWRAPAGLIAKSKAD